MMSAEDRLALAHASKIRGARVQRVVVVEALRGTGERDNPVRIVTEYWSLEGEFLAAEPDPEWPRP